MPNKKETGFNEKAKENLNLSPKQMDKFLKQAEALRRNLALRKQQQQERTKKCTPSK